MIFPVVVETLFREATYGVCVEEAIEILGIGRDDFVGEMWGNIDYTKLLMDRIGDLPIEILDAVFEGGYAQGEAFVFFKSFLWKYNGRTYRSINPATNIFEENYGCFKTSVVES